MQDKPTQPPSWSTLGPESKDPPTLWGSRVLGEKLRKWRGVDQRAAPDFALAWI
jgi:hypothetical protein